MSGAFLTTPSVRTLTSALIQAFVAAGILLAFLYFILSRPALGRGIAAIHPPIALVVLLGLEG